MEKDRPKVFYREGCAQCQRILDYLDDRNVGYDPVAVEEESEAEAELNKLSGQNGTPTIAFRNEILRRPDIPKLNAFLDRFHLDARPGDR